MAFSKGNVLKGLLRAVVVVLVLAVGLAAAAKFLIVPALVRWQLRDNLAEVWQGEVAVSAVEFSYRGPLRITGLELRDSAGEKWIEVGSVELTLGNWPSASPVLQAARIEGVRVRSHVRDGKVVWPLRLPERRPGKRDLSQYFDISKIEIENISLGIIDASGGGAVWDGLALLVEGGPEKYKISLNGPQAGGSETILSGLLTGSGEKTALSLSMSRGMTRQEMAALLGAFGLCEIREAAGRVALDVRLLGDWQEPDKLAADGTVKLDDWRVVPAVGPSLQGAGLIVEFRQQEACLNNFSASTCRGALTGEVLLQDLFSQRLTYSGHIGASQLDLSELSASFGSNEFHKGTGGAYFSVRGAGLKRDGLRADGAIALRNADLYSPRQMETVLGGLRLRQNMHLFTNLDGAFQIVGHVATIEAVKMTNNVTAVRVAKGGTVDLAEGDFDLHVVTIPVDQLDELARKLPGIEVASRLTDRLICFHVVGNWNRPDDVKVVPAPLESLQPSVLRDLVGAGKRAGEDAAKFLDDLLKLLESGRLPQR